MDIKPQKLRGPSPLLFVLWSVAMIALYPTLKKHFVPFLEEQWYRHVICAMAIPAEHLNLRDGALRLGAARPELPQSLYGIMNLQERLDHRLTILSFYLAWGDAQEQAFPLEAARQMDRMGYTLLITWEPWISAFQGVKEEGLASLERIAQGEFDRYIRDFARSLTRFGKPILLRPGHEMTNPQYAWSSHYGNTPEIFIRFWKHLVAIFREEGARNVIWVWSPFGLHDHAFYPGPEWVDVIGLDIFNYGSLSEQGIWMDFYSIAKLYTDSYRDFNRPIILAEVASSAAGGNKTDWLRDMFRSLKRGEIPEIRSLILFDIPSGKTPTGLPVDWSLDSVPQLSEILKKDSIFPVFAQNHLSLQEVSHAQNHPSR